MTLISTFDGTILRRSLGELFRPQMWISYEIFIYEQLWLGVLTNLLQSRGLLLSQKDNCLKSIRSVPISPADCEKRKLPANPGWSAEREKEYRIQPQKSILVVQRKLQNES